MVTMQLEKLHKEPDVATPGTGTPCRVHVLHHEIKKIYSTEKNTETQTLWERQKRQKMRGVCDPVGLLTALNRPCAAVKMIWPLSHNLQE